MSVGGGVGVAPLRVILPKYQQQPKSLRAGPGWCVASVPLPSGPNTGSNPREGLVLKKIEDQTLLCFINYVVKLEPAKIQPCSVGEFQPALKTLFCFCEPCKS